MVILTLMCLDYSLSVRFTSFILTFNWWWDLAQCEFNKADFTEWMSFLQSNLEEEIASNLKALAENT